MCAASPVCSVRLPVGPSVRLSLCLVCPPVSLSSVLSSHPSFCHRSCLPHPSFSSSVLSAYPSFRLRSRLPIRLFVFGLVCLFVFLFSVLSAYSSLFFFVFGLCPSVSLSSVLSVSPFLSFGQIHVRLLLFEWMCVFTAFLRIYPVWLSAYVPTYLSLLT